MLPNPTPRRTFPPRRFLVNPTTMYKCGLSGTDFEPSSRTILPQSELVRYAFASVLGIPGGIPTRGYPPFPFAHCSTRVYAVSWPQRTPRHLRYNPVVAHAPPGVSLRSRSLDGYSRLTAVVQVFSADAELGFCSRPSSQTRWNLFGVRRTIRLF
jgi:hypothetical protein